MCTLVFFFFFLQLREKRTNEEKKINEVLFLKEKQNKI